MRRTHHKPYGRCVRLVVAIAFSLWLLGGANASALIFGSPDSEPEEPRPPNFPYWENISQHRLGGPSVIYLGAGWILTARHVGFGEIVLDGNTYGPTYQSRHPLLNANASPADVIVFKLSDEVAHPDLPILPLASEPLQPGEEVLLIGFGRERGKVIEWRENGHRHFSFEWSERGAKRWGTNRVLASGGALPQREWMTHIFSFSFDEPGSAETTRFEAQAALGDSGGAVFVERDGKWQLAGMMVSISGAAVTSGNRTQYGDMTYAADIVSYRSEILRWARPVCFNEEDDDGDGKIDFPADPGCSSLSDSDERENRLNAFGVALGWARAGIGTCLVCAAMFLTFRQRKAF